MTTISRLKTHVANAKKEQTKVKIDVDMLSLYFYKGCVARLHCVVERCLLEVDLARFPKTLLAFLFLAEIHKNAIFAITTFVFAILSTLAGKY